MLVPAASVRATSPCDGDACIDGASAELLGSIDVWSQRCAEVDPARASQYLEGRKKFLADEDQPPGFVARLQASRFYPEAIQRINAEIDSADQKRRALVCDSLLRDARHR
jgi:hypothetical protein